MYFVYLLQCADGTLYTGITTDVARRLEEHKNVKKNNKGGHYTRAHGAARMVYVEAVKDRSGASKREAEIKSWRRAKKLFLIESNARHGVIQ